jgi:hypothetical protein
MMMLTLVEWIILVGESKVLGGNLPRRQFVHHKSHLPEPGANPGRGGGKLATNHFSCGAAHNMPYTKRNLKLTWIPINFVLPVQMQRKHVGQTVGLHQWWAAYSASRLTEASHFPQQSPKLALCDRHFPAPPDGAVFALRSSIRKASTANLAYGGTGNGLAQTAWRSACLQKGRDSVKFVCLFVCYLTTPSATRLHSLVTRCLMNMEQSVEWELRW